MATQVRNILRSPFRLADASPAPPLSPGILDEPLPTNQATILCSAARAVFLDDVPVLLSLVGRRLHTLAGKPRGNFLLADDYVARGQDECCSYALLSCPSLTYLQNNGGRS